MTTNHLERLDPALIRPGRVDLLELIDDAQPTQARRLYTRFYGGDEDPEDVAELERLAGTLEKTVEEEQKGEKRVSMAALQGLFIRSSPAEAVERCGELFVRH